MAREAPKKAQELGYEEVIARLEDVVKRLEGGNLPLEESLKAFEEGIALVRAGETRLNEAEKRVEQLLAAPSGDQVAPLEAPPQAENGRRAKAPGKSQGPEEPPPPGDEDIPF